MAQAAAAKKTAAPKKPSDRKAKGEPEVASLRPEDTPGWELLKPIADIPIWDQMPLISLLRTATEDSEELSKEEYAKLSVEERKEYNEKQEHRSFDIQILGDLALKLRDFAVDEDAYTKFCSGPRAMERSLNLAMAWVGQMGESIGSEDS